MKKENLILDQLKNLGIDGREAQVYLAILKMKKAKVVDLSQNTGIKRTTVYHSLDTLMEKGLVYKVEKDEKKHYYAENPKEALSNLIEERKSVLEKVIPDLKDIYGKGADQPQIKIYYNRQGLRKIFEDSLDCREKVARYFLSDFNLEELLGEDFVDAFVKKRIGRGIKSLALRSFNYKPLREETRPQRAQLREVKYMPEGLTVKPYICIYDNKVVLISSKEEKFGFIIESREFSEAQKQIFDMLWNNLAI